jgi:pimeloyl-ACP methyl ester carboxylesterase
MAEKALRKPRRFVQIADDLKLSYVEAGSGPDVVLIHGTLTTLEDMTLALSDSLTEHCRMIAFDRPGFGLSGRRRFLDAGVERQAARLWDALDVLEVETPVLVGHSFGASVALAMAVARPTRVKGVVALAPIVFPELRLEHLIFGPRAPLITGDTFAWTAHRTADPVLFPLLWRAMFLPQDLPDALTRAFPFGLAGGQAASVRVGEDCLAASHELGPLVARATTCATPVRVFGGDRDLVVRNGRHGRWLCALMPNAEFVDLPGLGHMAHHFAADRIARAINELTIAN